MRVKRYVAPSMPEAMQSIRTEMGREAVILHTRQFRQGGFWGLFGRNMVEVTAAIDEAERTKPAAVPMPPSGSSAKQPPEAVKVEGLDEKLTDLHHELKETRALMKQVISSMEPSSQPSALAAATRRLWRQLVENDVDPDLAEELITGVQAQTQDTELLEMELAKRITQILSEASHGPGGGKREIICLVGPTGVGKTTTIAKLAARAAFLDKKKVGLVTIDTYRVAAVEQLKTYAKILGLPVEVVFTPQDLRATLDRMDDLDMIFIDTAGRSHQNETQMAEIQTFLQAAPPTLTYLVLSLTTKYRDLLDIIAAYEPLHPGCLVFTKLDETDTYGSLLNIVALLQKQLAYVTDGQNVPDDIGTADASRLTQLVMGKKQYA